MNHFFTVLVVFAVCSVNAVAFDADSFLSTVNLDKTTNKVTVTVQSKVPLLLTVGASVYRRQPEFWRHEIKSQPDPLAGACFQICTQSVIFEAEKNMGIKGVEVAYDTEVVTLGFQPLPTK